MKILLAITVLLISTVQWNTVAAQLPEIPAEYGWETHEEYRASQSHVEKCLKWLCNSPLGDHVALRSETNAYVMLWLAGTPDYTITVNSSELSFIEDHPELLYSFIHGYASYQMNHKNSATHEKATLEGYKVVCELVLRSEVLMKDRALKPMIKAYKRGELKKFIEEQMPSK